MNKHFKTFSILAMITLLITGCGELAVQGRRDVPVAPKAAVYQNLLGKSINDKEVADFLVRNNCSSTGQFQVCKEAGMDLWINLDQIVKTIYLHLNSHVGYTAYKGELPFGLKFYDIQGAVEYKLKRQGVGNEGLPDEGSTPDHFHYWAIYKRYGMIIVYNFPYADEDATIHSILVSK
jgi:hypothetical protein